MKVKTMNDLFKKEKLIWETKIRKTGIKYESFTGIKLPEYKIKFIENICDIKYSMQIVNSTSPMILNVNMGFMLNKSFDYQSVAFHEFTHLCDYAYMLIDRDIKYRKTALHLFSEFHASYIESLHVLGLSNIDENPTKPLSEVEALIINRILHIEENILQCQQNKTVENIYRIIDTYMYYYGSLIAYNQFSSVSQPVRTFDFMFQNDMSMFYELLKFRNFDERLLEISYKIKTYIDKKVIFEFTVNKDSN